MLQTLINCITIDFSIDLVKQKGALLRLMLNDTISDVKLNLVRVRPRKFESRANVSYKKIVYIVNWLLYCSLGLVSVECQLV